MDNDEPTSLRSNWRVLIGMQGLAVGLIMLADRVGMSGVHLPGPYWPLFWPLLIVGAGTAAVRRAFESPGTGCSRVGES
jgi:hypothetical protein